MDENNTYPGLDNTTQNTEQGNAYQSGYENNYQSNDYQNNTYQNDYQTYQPFQQVYPNNTGVDMEEPMSLGEWMLTLLIMIIPCANLIMLFVWGFGSSEKKSKSNYCKAMLIYMAIFLGIWLLAVIFITVFMATALW